MHKNLKEVQPKDITNNRLKSIVNDIRKLLKEWERIVEINQGAIGIKHFYRSFIVKN